MHPLPTQPGCCVKCRPDPPRPPAPPSPLGVRACLQGLRKPAPAAFERVATHLQLPPNRCIFVDDRAVNVEAAVAAGMDGVVFEGAAQLESELVRRGLHF